MYQRAGGAKNEKSISEAARLLDRWEYLPNPSDVKDWAVLVAIGNEIPPRVMHASDPQSIKEEINIL